MAFEIPVHKHVLSNGLTVVVSPDNTTAMVAVNILYDVGARDESRKCTGLAHLFEHLMFGGSKHVADFDAELEAAGGRSNAWTSNDFTNFYLTLPAQNLATAFHLESDRMGWLSLTERALEVQKGVVIEEFKQQCLDRPYGNMFHRLRALCYSSDHPYSWPVLGLEPSHISRVCREDATAWYTKHYCPHKAILTVSGRVEPQQVFDMAELWFGDIAPGEPACRRHIAPGFPSAEITEEMHGQAPQTMIVKAVPMSAYGTEAYYAADAITDLLSAGRASRFNMKLVHGIGRGIITAADASILGSEDAGLLLITAHTASDSDSCIARARNLIDEELRRICTPGNISAHEWQRMQNNFEATFGFGNNSCLSRAGNLSMAVYHGEDINDTVRSRRMMNPCTVEEQARILFERTPAVNLIYRPA